MRALVITGPGVARVEDVEVPVPGAGQVVVDVRRAGICADRREVGIMGWPGALAEKVLVRASSLYRLPDGIDDRAGALVEPGGNGWRAATGRRGRAGKADPDLRARHHRAADHGVRHGDGRRGAHLGAGSGP